MKNIITTLKEVNNDLKERGLTATLTYRGETSHMVRCGRSQISLNVSKNAEKYGLTLQTGKKQISASITPCENLREKLGELATELSEKIEMMPEVDHLTPLTPVSNKGIKLEKVDRDLDQNFDSSVMVDLYDQADKSFEGKNVEISGAFSAGTYSYAVINTLVDEPLSYKGADYNVEIVLQLLGHNKQELRAASVGESLSYYDRDQLIDDLKRDFTLKTTTTREDVKAGEYDIVFSADAMGEMAAYMSYLTFMGEPYEYQSGMLQKGIHDIGTKIFGDNITITDHADDQEVLFARPIGMNGIERSKFAIVEEGILKNMYYSDKETCDRFGKEVNNDANVGSPKIHPGDGPGTFDEMVASCSEPTLYIGFIHYMNFTNQSKGEFTGTSRFGTWLIKDGKVTNHLYNLRINDSYHNIFNQVEWLSDKLTHINMSNTYGMRNAGSITCPSFIKVNKVHISGSNAPLKD